MKYWHATNKEWAEQQTLYSVLGYLQARRRHTEQVNIDELTEYIYTASAEIRKHLDEEFPEYAEKM